MLKLLSASLLLTSGIILLSSTTYLSSNLPNISSKPITLGHILQKQILEPSLLHLGYVSTNKYEQILKERNHFE